MEQDEVILTGRALGDGVVLSVVSEGGSDEAESFGFIEEFCDFCAWPKEELCRDFHGCNSAD